MLYGMQGFPDYFALVGLSTKGSSSWVRNPSLTDRYVLVRITSHMHISLICEGFI